MGWYSQGTQVIDFVENNDGTIRFAYAGHFIPENADTWVSHVFKTEEHADGTTTYYGATGDFLLGPVGRNSVDVWKVTLPPAPVSGPFEPDGGGGGGGGGGGFPGACDQKISGTKKADTLLGSIAGDQIRGGGGGDKIKARAGDDCARGGGGEDDVRGGAMNDLVKGGRAADSLKGGGGDDKVRDRSGGRDRLRGNGGADRLRSRGGGRDKVLCGKGEDRAVVDERDKTRGCEKIKRR
jgi:Ca2+-binding RTX toxin-like protein